MAEFFQSILGLPTELAYLTAAAIACVLIIHVVAVGALLFIWMERKVSGRLQDRLGPTRVGGKFGWLQGLADGIKLITKEDLVPALADKFLFKVAPYVSFAAAFTAFIALPFSDGWVALYVSTGIFFILAVEGLEVFGIILAGYASGSKWSIFGAIRAAAQVVSYEIPLGLCVLTPVAICGSLDLVAIANMQAGPFTNWLVLRDPATFCIFWIYFTCAIASVNRAPFDLAEAESELVGGFHTEYSGMRWSFFFMAEYGSMFLVSGIAAILFFGGWNGPIPIAQPLSEGLVGVLSSISGSVGFAGSTALWDTVAVQTANLMGCINFLIKGSIGVTVMIWVRWTLPRLRIDQVMTTCLKYCTPLAAFLFLGSVLWSAFGLWSPNDIFPVHPEGRGAIREPWVKKAQAEAEQKKAAAKQAAIQSQSQMLLVTTTGKAGSGSLATNSGLESTQPTLAHANLKTEAVPGAVASPRPAVSRLIVEKGGGG